MHEVRSTIFSARHSEDIAESYPGHGSHYHCMKSNAQLTISYWPSLLQPEPANDKQLSKSISGCREDFSVQSGSRSLSILQSTHVKSSSCNSRELLQPASELPALQQSNNLPRINSRTHSGAHAHLFFPESTRRSSLFQEVQVTMQNNATDDEVWQPGSTLSACQLSNQVQSSKLTTPARTGCSQDVLRKCVSSESPLMIAPTTACVLEVLPTPLTLPDLDSLPFISASESQIYLTSRLAGYAHEVQLPSQSGMQFGLNNDYVKKLKVLLVPKSVHIAQQMDHSVPSFQMILELYETHPHLTRGNSKEDHVSEKQLEVSNKHHPGEGITRELRPYENFHRNSHLRDSFGDNIVSDETFCSDSCSELPHKDRTTVALDGNLSLARNHNQSLSPSPFYDAQLTEFRSIWSSKRLQLAEVAAACVLQNDIKWITLLSKKIDST